jgi:drug/metabolite transporter (DMT)-like permease
MRGEGEGLNPYLGQLAALTVSFLFASTSTFFTLGGRQVGTVVLNRTRLLVAVAFIVLAHPLLGVALPLHAELGRVFWLAISGVFGLVIGDSFLFLAFVSIGPRLSMLLMALNPAIAALLAWIFLGEALSAFQVFAMALTLSGIAWVVLDTNGQMQRDSRQGKDYLVGILFGLGGAAGQALGLVTAKPGLVGGFPAISGTLIRMLTACVLLWAITLGRGQAGATLSSLRARPKAIKFILAGAFTGPFLGVTLSLFAIQNAEVGVASTLMALAPVVLLPVGGFVFGERIGWRAILGTLVAIGGVALLFLV